MASIQETVIFLIGSVFAIVVGAVWCWSAFRYVTLSIGMATLPDEARAAAKQSVDSLKPIVMSKTILGLLTSSLAVTGGGILKQLPSLAKH